jgi:hypothetical protein
MFQRLQQRSQYAQSPQMDSNNRITMPIKPALTAQKSREFEKEFWQYQQYSNIVNQISISNEKMDNYKLGISLLEKVNNEFKQNKFANCGEKVYYIYNELNKKGVTNQSIVEISGNSNDKNHVFNVIGMVENADITKPETWGQNAVIIDAFENKIGSVYKNLRFYEKAFGYNEENPMSFKKLDINEKLKT